MPSASSFAMVIGVLQFEVIVRDAESLKDKRRVVKSLKDRLHREHMVAVAEVGALDMLNLAVLALACVGIDGHRVGEVLDRVDAKLRAGSDYEIGSVSRQIIRGEQIDAGEVEPDASDLAAEMLARMRGDETERSA